MAVDLLPDAPDPANDTPQAFNQKAAAMVLAQKAIIPQLNAALAQFNAALAGGAYAIPFVFSTATVASDPGAGYMRLDNANVANASQLLLSTSSAAQKAVNAYVQGAMQSSSFAKATVRISSLDGSRYVVYKSTGITSPTGAYNVLSLLFVSSPGANFVSGETLMVFFQPTGDKGDTSAATPVLWVRDIRVAGTAGDNAAAGGYVVRALNDTRKNTIPSATVSANRVTLPPGTYRGGATAVAYAVNSHQCYFYNVTGGAVIAEGSAARAATGVVSESEIAFMEFTTTGTAVFELRHWTNTNTVGGLGAPSSNNVGLSEVYAQLYLEKIA